MATRDDSQTLRSVIHRFEESAEALKKLDETLSSLSLIREQQVDSSRSMQNASDELVGYVASLTSTNDLVRQSLETVRASLEAADKFLQGTDLTAVESAMGRTEMAVKSLDQSVETRDGATQDQLRALSESVSQLSDYVKTELNVAAQWKERAESDNSRLQAELDELRSKIAAIPPRVRMKVGL